MTRSRYDDLHDRFLPGVGDKAGTRYERLAALVLKSLDEKNAVIHDYKLIGSSTVKHQIDILLEKDGKTKRVLVECKDFDLSGNLVGLDIVRSFRSVVEDTSVDEAFIVTCTGYTQPAETFAKAKGIKLAVLRAFEDKDWEGRVRKIGVTFHIQMPPHIDGVDLTINPNDEASFRKAMGSQPTGPFLMSSDAPLLLVGVSETIQFFDWIRREVAKAPSDQRSVTIEADATQWSLGMGKDLFKFELLKVHARPSETITEKIEIGSDRIAELILQGFEGKDIVVFADQLNPFKINAKGHVGKKA